MNYEQYKEKKEMKDQMEIVSRPGFVSGFIFHEVFFSKK